MYCKYCGEEISDNSKFCPCCGNEIKNNISASGETVGRYQSLPVSKQVAGTKIVESGKTVSAFTEMPAETERKKKKEKRGLPLIICLMLLIIGAVVIGAVGLYSWNNTSRNAAELIGISFESNQLELNVGDNVNLSIIPDPENVEVDTSLINWESSKTSVATVENGTLTAVGEGEATITALIGKDISAECTVVVKQGNEGEIAEETNSEDTEVSSSEFVTENESSKIVDITGISLNRNTAGIVEGDSITLKVSVAPSNATNKIIIWNSSNPSVATVNEGVVKAIGQGKATITATAGEKSAKCQIAVEKATIKVSSVGLNKKTISLNRGSTQLLSAEIKPANATDNNLSWTSSNPAVATVSNGLVRAVGDGTATITVTAGGKSNSCQVSVRSVWSDWTPGYPSGAADIQSKTQYRYRDKSEEMTTSTNPSLSGWIQTGSSQSFGEWSSWSTSPISSSDSIEVETKTESENVLVRDAYTEYRYGRWTFNNGGHNWCAQYGVDWRASQGISLGNYPYYKEEYSNWSTTRKNYSIDKDKFCKCADVNSVFHKGNYYIGQTTHKACWHEYDGEYYWEESRTVPAEYSTKNTTYYRSRTVHREYEYKRTNTGTWSNWYDGTNSATSNRDVETRTVYRYLITN